MRTASDAVNGLILAATLAGTMCFGASLAAAADDDRRRQQHNNHGRPAPAATGAPAASANPAPARRHEGPRHEFHRPPPTSAPSVATTPAIRSAAPASAGNALRHDRRPPPAAVVAPAAARPAPIRRSEASRHDGHRHSPAVTPGVAPGVPFRSVTPTPVQADAFRSRMPRPERMPQDRQWHDAGVRHHHYRRPSPPWFVVARPLTVFPAPIFVTPPLTFVEVLPPPVVAASYPFYPGPSPTVVPPWRRTLTAVQITFHARALDNGPLVLDAQAAANTDPAQVAEFLRQMAGLPEVMPERACQFSAEGVAAGIGAPIIGYAAWTTTPVFSTAPGAADRTYWVVLSDGASRSSCLAYARTPTAVAADEAREDVRNVLTGLQRLGARLDLAPVAERVVVDLPPGAPIDPTILR